MLHNPYSQLIEAQGTFFQSKATYPIAFRLKMLEALKQSIVSREGDIIRALYKDLGKPVQEAITTEIGITLTEIKNAQKHLKSWAKTDKKATNLINFGSKAEVIHEPYGLTLIIAPWNYPFQLALAPLIGAIIGGNCAVLKPSEMAPATGQILEKIIGETFDEDYIAVAQGGVEVSNALLELKFDKIFFTGSPRVGAIVMEKAAKHLTPVTLELGGKSPCIIDETASLKLAVPRLIFGKIINAGQTCVAPDYILLHESQKNAFYDAFTTYKEKFFGKDMLRHMDYGKIINEAHYERIKSYLSDGNIINGGRYDDTLRKIELTLLEVEDRDRPVMKDEIFGPVLPVIIYKDFSELEAIIKENPNPLALYLFSRNPAFIKDVKTYIPFGGGCINDTIMHIANDKMPFGGRGTSGMGNYHGEASFKAFTHEKSVLTQATWFDLKMKYPPYKRSSLPLIKKLMY